MININIDRAKSNTKIFVNDIEQDLKDREDFNFSCDFINLPLPKEIRFVLPTTDLEHCKEVLYIKISE